MSAAYKPVSWTRSKLIYDAVALAVIGSYLLVYLRLGPRLEAAPPPDAPTLTIKAYGSCAFLLLTLILCIGPLARLDRRFLPLLYNRRHLGVLTCAVAGGHVAAVLGWYFAYSPIPPLQGLLGAVTQYATAPAVPFIPFGIFAFLVLLAMATTSHDFWLAFLTPPVWKALHMGVYAAYAALVAHVGFGVLQDAHDPTFAAVVALGVLTVTGLHLAAARATHREDSAHAPGGTLSGATLPADDVPWIVAGEIGAIPEDGAIVVHPAEGEAVAIFRHAGGLSAVSNVCAHQNGPLGEGRIVDGCITCPWHGYQYRPEDGCAPPPFTERLATYRLKRDGARLLLDPRPNPPGTYVTPLKVTP
jgi:nitrite reductase/ring-hydroxylating ferredoxin subunit/DMSO/TMAO reductase YedYZ heme-binding membrane subunit